MKCRYWFESADAAIDGAGVRDAGAHRIHGFAYLRVDRFSSSFRGQAGSDPLSFDAWLRQLKGLDSDAREYEFNNLPQHYFPLAGAGDRAAAKIKSRTCAEELARDDLATAAQREALAVQATVPDHYSRLKRLFGLYTIARIPFSKGVEAWHREATTMFRKTVETPAPAVGIVRYVPDARPVTAEEVGALFARPNADALGVPQFTAEQRDLLFNAYAPAFEIETTGEFDRIGPLFWRGSETPTVNIDRPVAYRRLAFTRFGGTVLTQLIYTIWFPERPFNSAMDMLSGRLDGVVLRMTLDSGGRPLVFDTIHPCGCYHIFIPTERVRPLPAPDGAVEWAFVPLSLPALAAAQRVAVSIASRTHYVVGVRPVLEASGTPYRLADENDLRALPVAGGGTRSAFGHDGIVPGTERLERFTFWPMGIDNSGAMRQWGTHATAFIGKRHFDDADLFELRFAPAPAGRAASAGVR